MKKHYHINVDGEYNLKLVMEILKKLGTLQIRWTSGRPICIGEDKYYISVKATDDELKNALEAINGLYYEVKNVEHPDILLKRYGL